MAGLGDALALRQTSSLGLRNLYSRINLIINRSPRIPHRDPSAGRAAAGGTSRDIVHRRTKAPRTILVVLPELSLSCPPLRDWGGRRVDSVYLT